MKNPIGKRFDGTVVRGKYGDLIVRLPEGDAAVLEHGVFGGPSYTFGNMVSIRVYSSNRRNPPTGFYAEVMRVEAAKTIRRDLREAVGVA